MQPAVDSVSFSVTPGAVCNGSNTSAALNASCSFNLFASLTPVQWASAVNGSSPSVVLYVALSDVDIYVWSYSPRVSMVASGSLVPPTPSALSPAASLAVTNTPAPGARTVSTSLYLKM